MGSDETRLDELKKKLKQANKQKEQCIAQANYFAGQASVYQDLIGEIEKEEESCSEA